MNGGMGLRLKKDGKNACSDQQKPAVHFGISRSIILETSNATIDIAYENAELNAAVRNGITLKTMQDLETIIIRKE